MLIADLASGKAVRILRKDTSKDRLARDVRARGEPRTSYHKENGGYCRSGYSSRAGRGDSYHKRGYFHKKYAVRGGYHRDRQRDRHHDCHHDRRRNRPDDHSYRDRGRHSRHDDGGRNDRPISSHL